MNRNCRVKCTNIWDMSRYLARTRSHFRDWHESARLPLMCGACCWSGPSHLWMACCLLRTARFWRTPQKATGDSETLTWTAMPLCLTGRNAVLWTLEVVGLVSGSCCRCALLYLLAPPSDLHSWLMTAWMERLGTVLRTAGVGTGQKLSALEAHRTRASDLTCTLGKNARDPTVHFRVSVCMKSATLVRYRHHGRTKTPTRILNQLNTNVGAHHTTASLL